MFTRLPMVMVFTSPRSTVLYQMLHSSPMVTSPTTTAVSARKQSFPILGVNPRTFLINAMIYSSFLLQWCGGVFQPGFVGVVEQRAHAVVHGLVVVVEPFYFVGREQ